MEPGTGIVDGVLFKFFGMSDSKIHLHQMAAKTRNILKKVMKIYLLFFGIIL